MSAAKRWEKLCGRCADRLRTECIYLAGNSASLEITISCRTVLPVLLLLWQRAEFLLLSDFGWQRCLHGLELTDSCNSTGYPITAVYSRARLAFNSSERRSLSAFAADMRPQSP